MGVRLRSATPGTLLCLACTVLLAVVSFNTPLLKSLYFLSASYSSGQYSGTLHLGTLGYCLTFQGSETCQGPQVGYEFNPNDLFGITLFNIPKTITKYLTYTLVLHIVALAFAALATVFGLLSHISTMSVWCFPTCFASIASSISLLAFIFDAIMFYIAKARIDDVDGASATIGISVWLVLAAWLTAGFGGCAFGVGRCCINRRNSQIGGDPKMSYSTPGYAASSPNDMRLQAVRDEQLRKKEQGLPSFQELEQTPLASDEEDKHLFEETPMGNSGLARDGSVLQGVGMGYGRRPQAQHQNSSGYSSAHGYGNGYGNYDNLPPPGVGRRISASSGITAGNAGVGAGGRAVESAAQQQQQGYAGYYGNSNHNYYDNGYEDPYRQQPYDYEQNQPYDAHAPQDPSQHQYPPVVAMSMPEANTRSNADPYASGSFYDRNRPKSSPNPYDAYEDGIGGIGRLATSPVHELEHSSRDYSNDSYGYGGMTKGYNNNGNGNRNGHDPQIHVPTPQHLITSSQSAQNLLHQHGDGYDNDTYDQGPYRSTSPRRPSDYHTAVDGMGDEDEDDGMGNRPPSYGAVAGTGGGGGHGYPNEKSEYR